MNVSLMDAENDSSIFQVSLSQMGGSIVIKKAIQIIGTLRPRVSNTRSDYVSPDLIRVSTIRGDW